MRAALAALAALCAALGTASGGDGGGADVGRAGMPVFVGKDEEASNLVRLKAKGPQAGGAVFSCEFKRTTRSAAAEADGKAGGLRAAQQEQAFAGIHRDVESILGKLSGVCIRKTLDYWKYELCFDSKITQSHGRDSFLLGTYTGMEGSEQLYEEGTRCEALPGDAGRESRVEFVCDTTLRLISVEEVSTCSYKIYVSTPVVCGHPDFRQSTRTIPGKGSKTHAGPPKASWFLELAEMNAGQVACSVAALDPASDLEFQDFELVLSAGEAELELKHELDVVRRKGRQALSKAENHYSVRRADENSRVTMSSAKKFDGKMTYALVQVVPTAL